MPNINHIAIIMDGNRRWARENNVPVFRGHEKGSKNLIKIAEHCYKKGVKYLTVYAFSTENWNRSKTEISALMKILEKFIAKELERLHENNIKVNVLGDVAKFPPKIQALINKTVEKTKNNAKMVLNIALNYGGRAEIVKAINDIREKIDAQKEVTEQDIEQNLYTNSLPEPEIMIRTGGEIRLSNFLLWQLAYSELFFTKTFWPAFSEADLDNIIEEFLNRKRNFGA